MVSWFISVHPIGKYHTRHAIFCLLFLLLPLLGEFSRKAQAVGVCVSTCAVACHVDHRKNDWAGWWRRPPQKSCQLKTHTGSTHLLYSPSTPWPGALRDELALPSIQYFLYSICSKTLVQVQLELILIFNVINFFQRKVLFASYWIM